MKELKRIVNHSGWQCLVLAAAAAAAAHAVRSRRQERK